MQRRDFLKQLGAGLLVWQTPSLLGSLSHQVVGKKLVWVILRGGMDSLQTVIPAFEPELSTLRPTLAPAIADKVLAIDNGFALHPSLINLHQWYKNKEFLPIIAVSSGYAKRSHFDGQDFLESGLQSIDHNSGWLARAIDEKNQQALAIQNSTPLSLRSSDNVNTWYPSNLKESSSDIYEQLMALYQYDDLLQKRLIDGLKIKEMAGQSSSHKRRANFTDLTTACAKLMMGDPLKGENTVNCAMLELGGWDTHNNQTKRLTKQLTELDNGLAALKNGLSEKWDDTVVIIATEFGRTVKENGTAGTDHGSASTLMLAGGAVSGGQVLGNWPGLAKNKLFEERDLMPTTNSFAWLASVLAQHWDMDKKQLQKIFPGIKPYNDVLIKKQHI
jgi:uncharacterized protein (DUF1501 family)